MKTCLVFILLGVLTACTVDGDSIAKEAQIPQQEFDAKTEKPTESPTITLQIGENTFSVTLEANETTEALLELLPLTCSMSELNGNEKFAYLPQALPKKEYSPGEIHAGDILLYGDDCLVLFYQSFPTSYRYTYIGHIDNIEGLAQLDGTGDITANFTK